MNLTRKTTVDSNKLTGKKARWGWTLGLCLLVALAAPPVCSAQAVVTIMQIQGSGQFSPLVGQTVQTTGVVTLITANGRDMWIQDILGDGDPATSDGIFVDDRNRLFPPPQIGDLVTVIGEVEELQFGAALPLTRIDDTVLVGIISSGNPLPAPVKLKDLPNVLITDGIDFWEPLEGMLVSVENAHVVAATSRFGEFGMVTREDAKPGSGFFPQNSHLLIRSLGGEMVDFNPERILVDDATVNNAIIVRPGDRVRSLVGVVDYTFGAYKLQPASFDVKTHALPNLPASKPTGFAGDTTITTFNVENLFDLIDNPAKADRPADPDDLETQLTKLALAIEIELRTPEIIVAQEVENTAILQELGDRVNAATGTAYVATSFETSDARGIEAAFLWDSNRVTLQNAFQLSDAIVPGVSAAFGPGSPSPGREPLVGMFEIRGREITLVGNHFKSKFGDDPLFGVNQPPIRITEVQRKAQAQVVRDYVNILLNADPQALVMVIGDLNDFEFAEPGEGPDHPVAIIEGGDGEVPLTNLLQFEGASERFTFVFDGNSQVLDHILVSPALLGLFRGTNILHFNAGFPDAVGSDASSSIRASDHDALESQFKFK